MNNKSQIKRLSNGEMVDLSKLDKSELRRLHYEEEKFVAEQLCKMKPFSEERYDLLRQGYSVIRPIMFRYRSSGESKSYGATERSVKLVCDFIEKQKSGTVHIYEAGVGAGFSCEHFLKFPNVIVKGCDVVIYDKVKQLSEEYPNFQVDKDTLYNSLKNIEDESIDIFYADNVIEHIFPDEFPQILDLLSRKVKKRGVLILIIPNKYVGPNDVSRYFVARGKKPEGFHFMEMSYREVITKFKEAGFMPAYFLFRGIKDQKYIKYIKDVGGILNSCKIWIESVLGLFIKWLGSVGPRIFNVMALNYYVLVKK